MTREITLGCRGPFLDGPVSKVISIEWLVIELMHKGKCIFWPLKLIAWSIIGDCHSVKKIIAEFIKLVNLHLNIEGGL